jgi:hypothetical protein
MKIEGRESSRLLIFSASLRAGSLNTRLVELAAGAVEGLGPTVDLASMRDFRRSVGRRRCRGHRRAPARGAGVARSTGSDERRRHRLARVRRVRPGC